MSEPDAFGAYVVERLLGGGSFADVYLCYHSVLDTRVAVKVLHPHLSRQADIRDRFTEEARLLWRTDSDRIIGVTHVDETPDGRPYLVMRVAERDTLDHWVRLRRELGDTLTNRQLVGLGLEFADCLDTLRSYGVVHRDLKPQNILVKVLRHPDTTRAEAFDLPADERLVLADFGLAKTLSDGTNLLSQLGGTPLYMAPELASFVTDLDWRADLFSIGVLVHELLTGSPPWPERSWDRVRDIDPADVDPLRQRPDLPAGWTALIRRALALDPADRHASPGEFADELHSLLESPASTTRPAIDATDLDRRVTQVCVRARQLTDDPARRAEADRALHRLVAPLRIGVVAGSRIGPVPLAIRLVGERFPPGGASVVGSVVTRIEHGPLGAQVLTSAGEVADGRLSRAADATLELTLPVAAWQVDTLVLRLDDPQVAEHGIVDLPYAVVRRRPDLATSLLGSVDAVLLGLPPGAEESRAAVDELLALLPAGEAGPVCVIGVEHTTSSASGIRHPALLATVPSDATAEIRLVLDEVLGGDRTGQVRSSAALRLIERSLHPPVDPTAAKLVAEIERIRADVPALSELDVVRRDLAGSDQLPDHLRLALHRLLARQQASARLGLGVGAPHDELIAEAGRRHDEWVAAASSDLVPPTRRADATVVVESLERLARQLSERPRPINDPW